MNVKKLGGGRLYFEYRYRGELVRRNSTLEAITAFLRGEIEPSANLVPSAMPMTLEQFMQEKYLPFCARPRIDNDNTWYGEVAMVKALGLELGESLLHEITSKTAEDLREKLIREKRANSTIKKWLNGLRRILDYAVRKDFIKQNPVPPVRGLKIGNRSGIWLKLAEIERLLEHCHPLIRPLVLYMVLTGARVTEALDCRNGDIRGEKLYVPTEKCGKPCREVMREFDSATLGPRFVKLIGELKPHPETGFYFYANEGKQTALSYNYFLRLFNEAKKAAGLGHIRPHDLRGTFCMHRAMVVQSFRQLQIEMGHGDPRSIQSYLDRAKSFDPKESIFSVSGVAALVKSLANDEKHSPVEVGVIAIQNGRTRGTVHKTAQYELNHTGNPS